ncbi:Heme-binding protein HMX1 like [Verticillium longisporum]|nr:Heme-binding protein HMX1 like [Verticillium longisporum]
MLSSTEASASSGSPQRPLSDSINAATRTIHAKLNKLIIARLPLSLPPHAQDPSTYASGLLHIAPIYITFESWWHGLVSARPAPGADAAADRIHDILSSIYFPDLMRADRLCADIAQLTGWSADTVNQKLDTVARHGSLADFLRHVSRALENRPHVLIAYAYILFMALFAGGRFIRATLESVGTSVPEPGFWNHLKRDFKASLASIEPLLSAHDRHDVVQEAICIFDNMLRLVGQLDVFCNTDLEAEPGQQR